MATVAKDRSFERHDEHRRVPRRRRPGAICGAVLTFVIAGCMLEGDTPRLRVTREEFGDAWPLTVPAGALSCEGHREITFQWKGTEYTLTGEVASAYSAVEPIWARGPDGATRKALGPLIERGRTLCK